MSILHSLSTGAFRVLASGALAVGLVAIAPTTEAHAATAHHHEKHHHSRHHRAHHHQHVAPSARRVGSAMSIAVHQKGDPYRYGAAGPGAFDCSGLTYYAFRKAGFKRIPRTSSAQAHFARHIKRTHMRRGDLMFFYDGGGVYHVGVYAGFSHGHRWVLHAPHSGTRVRTDRLWTDKWYAGTLRYRR